MKKNTNKKSIATQMKVTTLFGYSLFAITIMTLIISTVIPFAGLALDPHTINHTNTMIVLIALVAGAVFPTLISYFLGDRATHLKNKVSHHYNGVLFGIAAYWVALFFNMTSITNHFFSSLQAHNSNLFLIVNNAWPIVTTSIVMIIVALSYVKHQKNKPSVLEHRPYQIVLIGSITAFFAYLYIGASFHQFEMAFTSTLQGVLSQLVPLVITILAYNVLKSQRSKSVRLSTALIVMSLGGISSSLAAQIISYNIDTFYDCIQYISQAVGVLVSLLFLWLISRKR
ncbi:MAG: hypothetical protein ABI716_00965 [Candidatus Saccharibacteria bacterium]